jgi:hypothetical protein
LVTATQATGIVAIRGLTAIGAARRLARDGPNEVEAGRPLWALRLMLEFASNPLGLILLAA